MLGGVDKICRQQTTLKVVEGLAAAHHLSFLCKKRGKKGNYNTMQRSIIKT